MKPKKIKNGNVATTGKTIRLLQKIAKDNGITIHFDNVDISLYDKDLFIKGIATLPKGKKK